MGGIKSPRSNRLCSKFRGCMLGLAIGDALGAPFEGASLSSPARVGAAVGDLPRLCYTDDTHMAIGMAESLLSCRKFDGPDMAERFTRNYEQEPWRGYGPGPPRIFRKIRAGAPWDEAAQDIYPGGSYGNGSAMRVAPLALFFHQKPAELVNAAREQSRITHPHPLGKEGAVLQALAVALAVGDKSTHSYHEIAGALKDQATTDVYRQKLVEMETLLKMESVKSEDIAARLGNGIEAFNSVPAAIYCALRHPGSFEESVLAAVALGGDADTIACMAGAISGARLGLEAIPEEWLTKLENRAHLERLAVDLWKEAG